MDSFTEKKWFIYVGDHHEGPFSLEEVQGKIGQGQTSAQSYVWREGMADWKAMAELSDFAPLLSPPPPTVATASTPNLSLEIALNSSPEEAEKISTDSLLTAQLLHSSHEIESKTEFKPEDDTRAIETFREGATIPQRAKTQPQRPKSKSLRVLVLLLLMVLGVAFAFTQGYLETQLKGLNRFLDSCRPYLVYLIDRVPSLGEWISPLPVLEEVSNDEYEALKSAALEDPMKFGPRIAVALFRDKGPTPSFYVASRLPDGTQFRVFVIGIGDTLVNQTSFMTQLDVTLNQRLGKTSRIQLPAGKVLARGEYMVYLSPTETEPPTVQPLIALAQTFPQTSSELPKDIRVLGFKTYFLGGTRDASYTSQLKEYHDKLRMKAADEISEVTQFLTTLESQLNSTSAKFALMKKGKVLPKQRQAWQSFHTDWMKLEGQLDQIFQNLTPESVQNDYFYGSLYQMTHQVVEAVGNVHSFHQSYFTGIPDLKTFEIQIGEATSSAQTLISLLRAKIGQASSLAPTANGMPRRDGI